MTRPHPRHFEISLRSGIEIHGMHSVLLPILLAIQNRADTLERLTAEEKIAFYKRYRTVHLREITKEEYMRDLAPILTPTSGRKNFSRTWGYHVK
jgi:hypothetical protein